MEVGPELLVAPTWVMKMSLVRKIGTRPVLQEHCVMEPRHGCYCWVTHQSQKHFTEFAIKYYEITGLDVPAAMPGLRCPCTVQTVPGAGCWRRRHPSWVLPSQPHHAAGRAGTHPCCCQRHPLGRDGNATCNGDRNCNSAAIRHPYPWLSWFCCKLMLFSGLDSDAICMLWTEY